MRQGASGAFLPLKTQHKLPILWQNKRQKAKPLAWPVACGQKVIKDEYLLKSANNSNNNANGRQQQKAATRLKNIFTFLQHFRKSLLTSYGPLVHGAEEACGGIGLDCCCRSVPVNYALISSFL